MYNANNVKLHPDNYSSSSSSDDDNTNNEDLTKTSTQETVVMAIVHSLNLGLIMRYLQRSNPNNPNYHHA